MTWNLFIDDLRDPASDGNWVIARSSETAINEIKNRGWPGLIAFDHDLGGEDTSRPVVEFLINQVLDEKVSPQFLVAPTFWVHSQNPVGRDWIFERMADLKKAIKLYSENQ